jgi:LmbE family N-acetylglucosaminyl deacetylase
MKAIGRQRKYFLFFMLALTAAPRLAAQSVPETVEAISRARVATRILYVTAHPDDESSVVLTYLARALNAEVALVSTTRGEGGQNAIGPEQGAPLGILRTEELLAATRGYGVGLYFTRSPDFGYSKSADETLKIWGDTTREDLVRVIRTFRPNIVINQWGSVHSGHGQHQATGIVTPRAVAAAGDPQAYPAQLAEGLAVWRVDQVLQMSRGDSPPGGAYRVRADEVSPLWGKSYGEIGRDAFGNHRSQGVTAFLDSPFLRRAIYLVPAEGKKFELGELAAPFAAIPGKFPELQSRLAPMVTRADASLEMARQSALDLRWAEAAKQLAKAGGEMASAQDSLCKQRGPENAAACWELDHEKGKIDAALADAVALRLDARSDRSELVAGQDASVSLQWNYRANTGVKLEGASVAVPSGWSAKEKDQGNQGAALSASFTVSIPASAVAQHSPEDAVLPFPPPLIRGHLEGVVNGYAFAVEEPARAMRLTSTRVDVSPLTLVPAVSLTVEPQHLMAARAQLTNRAAQIELLARVRYHGTGNARVETGLTPPAGWSFAPAAPLDFTGAGDQLVRFVLRPPANAAEGSYPLKPYARLGEETFRTAVEPVATLPTRLWSEPADATVHVLDLSIPQKLSIGYIGADNDLIPETLRQLGIQMHLLDEAELAFADLHPYDAIVVGIRAYELRDDLVRANQRLLEYVKDGGTLVVQYQRNFGGRAFSVAPFPASMPDDTARTTDEDSPVRFVAPSSPLLNFPNKITMRDFDGWAQERGLYYWGKFDAQYQPVLAFRDPGEEEELGGLVYARDGKGVYIYTGIAFFRQLPDGVPGAYRLFVNLLSQSRRSQTAQ